MQNNWRNNYSRYKGFFLDTVTAYKKKPEIIMFLEIILTFSTITMLSIFALKPTLVTIAGLVKEIESKEELIVTMDKKISDLEKAQRVIFENSKQISILNLAIPTGPSVESFAGQIEGLSATISLPISSFTIGETSLTTEAGPSRREKENILPEGTDSLNATLRIAGAFDKLKEFLDKAENMRRPLVMESAVLSQTKDVDSGSVLGITISCKVPYVGN